jgi:hypothetical protein
LELIELEDVDYMTLAEWLKRYGQITAYTIAVVTLTVFLVRFDQRSADANRSLTEIRGQVNTLAGQVNSLQNVLQDQAKYERWRRGFNARLRRAYAHAGWEYEEVE